MPSFHPARKGRECLVLTLEKEGTCLLLSPSRERFGGQAYFCIDAHKYVDFIGYNECRVNGDERNETRKNRTFKDFQSSALPTELPSQHKHAETMPQVIAALQVLKNQSQRVPPGNSGYALSADQ
jgi:hypothetical protein